MDKKANSKPMREILARLLASGEFEFVPFGDKVILNSPIEEWPECDCLLSWHSDGFPLSKAQEYAALRRPFLVNDLKMQQLLLDRRTVYKILQEHHIPVPHHIIVDRDNLPPGESPQGFEEGEDYVQINGVRMDKPFVEKPISGENHNIYIYYPHSMGGGVKYLYRKVDNRSADYDPNHPGTIRRDGSYIYETFLPTGGTDVKVYTVGPRYAHAEARKSPVVDGKVNRTPDGKEVRFPVLLSPQEKEIARMVCLAVGQKVCGFDLLRSENGKSYVCDVNGWSFVKNSKKYYDDAAGILRSIILSALDPHRLNIPPPPIPFMVEEEKAGAMREVGSFNDLHGIGQELEEDEDEADGRLNEYEELRCVLAVIRHGDRTPKQKMKMRISEPPLLELFEKYKDSKGKQAKLKSPAQLQELLDITRTLVGNMERRAALDKDDPEESRAQDAEMREKLRIVRTVLEQGGHFSGINRKVQLKPLRYSVMPIEMSEATNHGANASKPTRQVAELQLILKYGGVLTHAGRKQAEDLGKTFRMMLYPRYGPQGGGLLRLHSTYRHDLKIYSSDEGRVQMSAAAFTKGLLDLEGTSLTPILVSLVNKNASMLDAFGKGASEDIRVAKQALYSQMTWDEERGVALCSNLPALSPSKMATPLVSPPKSPQVEPVGTFSSSGAALNQVPSQLTTRGLDAETRSNSLNFSEVSGNTPLPSTLNSPYAKDTVNLHASQLIGGAQASPQKDMALCGTVPAVDSSGGYISHPQGVSGRMSTVSSYNSLCSGAWRVNQGGPQGDLKSENESLARWASLDDTSHFLVKGMPENPLKLLRELVDHMKILVDQLREKCLGHNHPEKKPYSSLTNAPEEWELDPDLPCSGERMLLLFDRWRKLLKSFYNDKKDLFDISKVPDIYDSAKYDCIHNAHLNLDLEPVYRRAKVLADAVIPNEYGIDSDGKLRIGAKICEELVGKLLADLASMRQESIVTAAMEEQMQQQLIMAGSPGTIKISDGNFDSEFGLMSLEDELMMKLASRVLRDYQDGEGAEEGQGQEAPAMHRLCPSYASDINSPMRHVRTRIYFTSESHIHSLMNVLRFCHLPGGQTSGGLMSPEGAELVNTTREYDYLTNIVLRMYENKAVPVDHRERFRVEILFSPGAAHSPVDTVPLQEHHMLPPVPWTPLHHSQGVTLEQLEEMVSPYSVTHKLPPSIYALQVALKAPQQTPLATSRAHSEVVIHAAAPLTTAA